jgi:NADH-quinone oxidoreductase subunit N
MDLSSLKVAQEWSAIYPELTLGLLALGLLVLEIVLPRRLHAVIPRIAVSGQVALLVFILCFDRLGEFNGKTSFGGLLAHDGTGQAFRVFFLLAGSLVTWLGIRSLEKQTLPRIEFFHIVLVATGAMMLLVQSQHFVMLFVALETVTVSFYVLVSYFRTSTSLEAGLKYLILGALSSAMLTFGIVLLYGVAGNRALDGATEHSLGFANLGGFLQANPHNTLALIGVILVLCGIAFKIGAVPFQIWIPDVYQGAPTPVTAFLAVSSKAAGFGVLLHLITGVFRPVADTLMPGLIVVTAATILFGNFAALTQRNTKRLMGLSGVSHAGYLLLGVLAALSPQAAWASGAVVFYLFTYLLASMAVFGVLTYMSDSTDVGLETDDFADLGKNHPLLATVLAVGLGSLAGIPPLAGFVGKALLFVAAFQAGLYSLLGVAILGVILSIYYYFGWIRQAVFGPEPGAVEDSHRPPREVSPIGLRCRIVLAGLALATVVLGFFQGPLSAWVKP